MTSKKNRSEDSVTGKFTCPHCGAQRSMYKRGFHMISFCGSCGQSIEEAIKVALEEKQKFLEESASKVGAWLVETGIPVSAITSIVASGILRKIMLKSYVEAGGEM